MTLPPNYSRLRLSPWPFLILAVPEFFGLINFLGNVREDAGLSWVLGVSAAAVGASLAVMAIALPLVFAARRRPWGRGLRSTAGVLATYGVLGVVQTIVILVVAESFGGHGGLPLVLAVLFALTRPVNLVILAIVVGQLQEGFAAMRIANGEVADRIVLARQTNVLLERAETAMRAESRTTLDDQVRRPLTRLVRDAQGRPDAEVADDLDAFVAERLRPLSHVLHPVSVRLGLVSAVRSLDPDILMDAPPAVERMDRDGVLLDETVRLQVYRWIRDRLVTGSPTRVALVLRGRELEVSVHPAAAGSPDAVQVVAGLRELGRGVLRAPLRGQIPAASAIASDLQASAQPIHVRQRLRDVLTTPLPRRTGLVALIALGLLPYQMVAFQLDVEWRSVVLGLVTAGTAIVLAAIFSALPRVRHTTAGAIVVVAEWIATGVVPALAFSAVASSLGLYATFGENIALDVFRSTYRFTLVGLMLVIAHGVVAQAHRALELATADLDAEERRREEILAQSRQLDADVAEALHRTVQGRLAAAVVLIRLGRRAEAWEIVEDMAGVEIPRLLDRMQAPSGVVPVAPTGMRIDVYGAEALPEELVADIRTALGEIAVNAQRHGDASQLVVRIFSKDGQWIVDCLDNGRGPGPQMSAGLGSRLLEELTVRHGGYWSMTTDPEGCRVTLAVLDPSLARTSSFVNA